MICLASKTQIWVFGFGHFHLFDFHLYFWWWHDIWGFEKIDSLPDLFKPVLEMTLFDSGSIVIAGVLLWNFCRINIFHEYCKTMAKYWKFLALGGNVYTSAVSTFADEL